MSYHLRLAKPAEKKLDALDRPTEERIWKRLRELSEASRDSRLSKELVEAHGLRSSRVGDWRILYMVDDREKLLDVVAIRPRGQAYRDL